MRTDATPLDAIIITDAVVHDANTLDAVAPDAAPPADATVPDAAGLETGPPLDVGVMVPDVPAGPDIPILIGDGGIVCFGSCPDI
jgi:hypothetical protein